MYYRAENMNRFIETLLIITFLNGAFSLKFEKSFTIPKIDEFSPVMASDWSIVRLISRRLYVENNTAFSISLECNNNSTSKYLMIFDSEQEANGYSDSPYYPSYVRYEVPNKNATPWVYQFNIDRSGTYYFDFYVTKTISDIKCQSVASFVGPDGSRIPASDINLYRALLPMMIIFILLSFGWFYSMYKLAYLVQPLPIFLFSACVSYAISCLFYYIYFSKIEQTDTSDLQLIYIALAFKELSTSFFLLFGGTVGVGWSIIEKSIPPREQAAYLITILGYFLFGIIKNFLQLQTSAFFQLIMEFIRIFIAFSLSIALRATAIRCRIRASSAVSSLPQDRRIVLSMIVYYNRMNFYEKIQDLLPAYIIMPTFLIFIQSELLGDRTRWFGFLAETLVFILVFLYFVSLFLPKTIDVSGGIFKNPKHEKRREIFSPNLFIKPVWYSGSTTSGFWDSFAVAMFEWSNNLPNVFRSAPTEQHPNAQNNINGNQNVNNQ